MSHDDDDDDYRLMKLSEVLRFCGLSKSRLYELMAAGLFPRSRRTGPRSVAWLRKDLKTWNLSRPFSSENPPGRRSPAKGSKSRPPSRKMNVGDTDEGAG